MAIKECVVCGGSFDARGTALTCSLGCRAERDRSTRKSYRDAHPEMNREECRKWRTANPKKARESSRAWENANPSKMKEARREWRKKNRERCNEHHRKWVEHNPEKHQELKIRDSRAYYDRLVAAYQLIKRIEKEGLSALL